jgi:hypothetical protein
VNYANLGVRGRAIELCDEVRGQGRLVVIDDDQCPEAGRLIERRAANLDQRLRAVEGDEDGVDHSAGHGNSKLPPLPLASRNRTALQLPRLRTGWEARRH